MHVMCECFQMCLVVYHLEYKQNLNNAHVHDITFPTVFPDTIWQLHILSLRYILFLLQNATTFVSQNKILHALQDKQRLGSMQ